MPLPSALTKFFLVFQIIFDHPKYFRFFQKKLDVAKKNLAVQTKFGHPKNVFHQFFLMEIMFLMTEIFFYHPKCFLEVLIFLDTQIFFLNVQK